MLLSRLGGLALAVGLASAYKDTSPFFLFSTSELLTSSPDLVSASSIQQKVVPQLKRCPSDTYVIVSQPGVSAADYHDPRSAPHLRMMMLGENKNIRSSLNAKDVLGSVNVQELSQLVQSKCGARHVRVDASTGSFTMLDDYKPQVVELDFPALPDGNERASKLSEHDAFLASVLDLLPSNKYTVVYTTTPSHTIPRPSVAESEPYQMDTAFQAPVHMDLKRDLSHYKRASDITTLPDGPLFERYQFLTPGLFMGIVAFLIAISILYVAISAVSSLQVSYAAFDKDMGPAAQKKQG